MQAEVALTFLKDRRQVYANYEQLVKAGVRRPAAFANDAERAMVAGALFGHYGDQIRYGALSINNDGLPTYGELYVRLSPMAIKDRVSFLETNSYIFVNDHGLSPSKSIPDGFRADWDHRALLAGAKLGDMIQKNSGIKDFQQLLIVSNGTDRGVDDFIEAHIFGGFNLDAIEDVVPAVSINNMPREKRTIARVALEAWSKVKKTEAIL